jgi:hypothetical protein
MTAPERCRSGGAEIVWAKTAKGKFMPLDAAPVKGGKLALVEGERMTHIVAADPEAEEGYVSHYATCPQAAQWRKAKST